MARVLNPYDVVGNARREQRTMTRRGEEHLNFGRNLAGNVLQEWVSPRTVLPLAAKGTSALLDRAAKSKRLAALGLTAGEAEKQRMSLMARAMEEKDSAGQTYLRQRAQQLGYALDSPGRSLSQHLGGQGAGLGGAMQGDKLVRSVLPTTFEKDRAARAQALREQQTHEANIADKQASTGQKNAETERLYEENYLKQSTYSSKVLQAQVKAEKASFELEVARKDEEIAGLKRRLEELELRYKTSPTGQAQQWRKRMAENQRDVLVGETAEADLKKKQRDIDYRNLEIENYEADAKAKRARDYAQAARLNAQAREIKNKDKERPNYKNPPYLQSLIKNNDDIDERLRRAAAIANVKPDYDELIQLSDADRVLDENVKKVRSLIRSVDPAYKFAGAPSQDFEHLRGLISRAVDNPDDLRKAAEIGNDAANISADIFSDGKFAERVVITDEDGGIYRLSSRDAQLLVNELASLQSSILQGKYETPEKAEAAKSKVYRKYLKPLLRSQ